MTPAKTLDELERNVEAHLELQRVKEWCENHRATLLYISPPRTECPGCFARIYDGAAEQGWCCDCFASRHRYASDSRSDT